jgi:allantoicase
MAPNVRSKVCWGCKAKEYKERTDPFRMELQRLWLAGSSIAELADHFGWPRNRVGPEMARMRAYGWDMPRRSTNGRTWVDGTPVVRTAND